jgi:hypothetical protein
MMDIADMAIQVGGKWGTMVNFYINIAQNHSCKFKICGK